MVRGIFLWWLALHGEMHDDGVVDWMVLIADA